MLRTLDLPPVWLIAFVSLGGLIGQLAPVPVPALQPLALGMILAGLALICAAVLQMRTARTSFIPRRDPAALVTTGAFRLSRNPIYLGDALVLTGALLRLDAPHALVLVPLFVWLITAHFIRGEEARIARTHPSEWRAYSARTRRWL